jgi:hypothetical protein
MPKKFISEPIEPSQAQFPASEPSLPPLFVWRDEELRVQTVVRTWRSTKDDRGDTYLKRHWFEFDTSDGRRAVVYFDRAARRGSPRWWLYSLG